MDELNAAREEYRAIRNQALSVAGCSAKRFDALVRDAIVEDNGGADDALGIPCSWVNAARLVLAEFHVSRVEVAF
jgi:hypothetical protein